MLRGVAISLALAVAVPFWFAGMRLFLATEMPARRKLGWSGFLVVVGVGVGLILPLPDLATKFLWMLGILPILAAVDVMVLRGKRGFTYWIRACGFEVCTVFGTAAMTRVLLDVSQR